MKILVVDDDPTCRAVVAIRLKGLGGIEVTQAADGDEAWALLKHNHYDGAIVDWQMPGKSGLEIVRAIRTAGIAIPLLMVTGESERDRVIEAIHAGITDYLIKPFDTQTLLAKLGRLVELTAPKTHLRECVCRRRLCSLGQWLTQLASFYRHATRREASRRTAKSNAKGSGPCFRPTISREFDSFCAEKWTRPRTLQFSW